MSYRTYVNDYQIFGNNECYDEWIDFLKTQNVYIDSDYNYEGTIKDVMGAIVTLEKIVIRLENEHRARIKKLRIEDAAISNMRQFTSLFNFAQEYDDFLRENEANFDDTIGSSITDKILGLLEYGFVFLPYQFINACADSIERDTPFSTPKHFNCYKLKEGCEIRVEAH